MMNQNDIYFSIESQINLRNELQNRNFMGNFYVQFINIQLLRHDSVKNILYLIVSTDRFALFHFSVNYNLKSNNRISETQINKIHNIAYIFGSRYIHRNYFQSLPCSKNHHIAIIYQSLVDDRKSFSILLFNEAQENNIVEANNFQQLPS